MPTASGLACGKGNLFSISKRLLFDFVIPAKAGIHVVLPMLPGIPH
jgi:hypothetical protein